MAIRVCIVEDDDGIRESLAGLINAAEGFECVSGYASAEDALTDLPQKKPDVVLMDINLPKMSGVECVQKLKAIDPNLQLVMLTVYDDEDLLFRSLTAGATGYLLKRTPPEKLLEAIKEVHGGCSPMSGQIARMVVQYFNHLGHASLEKEQLTARETEILHCLAKGYRYKEIAEKLAISFDTVRTHLRSIYEKLHVHSRTEAVVKYLRR